MNLPKTPMIIIWAEAEEVISIFRSRMLEIHTTRSWDFMGLSLHIQNEQSAGMQLKYGDDIIVGILDTGKFPDSFIYL
jgi:hypothetical protein